jgi:hypothetical protein
MTGTAPEIYSTVSYMDEIVKWAIKNKTTSFTKKDLPSYLKEYSQDWHRRAISRAFIRIVSRDQSSGTGTYEIAGRYRKRVIF